MCIRPELTVSLGTVILHSLLGPNPTLVRPGAMTLLCTLQNGQYWMAIIARAIAQNGSAVGICLTFDGFPRGPERNTEFLFRLFAFA